MTTWFNVFQARSTVSLSTNGLVQLVSSTIVQGFAIAYFLYLTWDAPFVNMVKLFTGCSKKENEKEKIYSSESSKLTGGDDKSSEMTEKTVDHGGLEDNGKLINGNKNH